MCIFKVMGYVKERTMEYYSWIDYTKWLAKGEGGVARMSHFSRQDSPRRYLGLHKINNLHKAQRFRKHKK